MNVIIVAIYFVGAFELFRWLNENWYKWGLYKKSFHDVSFFDLRMEDFLNVRDIKNNTILFKDGSLGAILRIKSIEGTLLDEEERKIVTEIFGSALKSIPFEVRMFAHSVDPNVDDFFENTDTKIMKQEWNQEEHLNWNKETQKWLMGKMKEADAKDKISYFMILYKPKIGAFTKLSSLLYLLNLKDKTELKGRKIKDVELDKAIKEVNVAVNNAKNQLEKTKVVIDQLNDDQLIGLFPSYFLNVKGIGKSNLSPFMWLKKKNEEES